MKKEILSVFLLIVSFLLQSTLLSRFTLGGIVPNLMIVMIATLGFLLGNRTGMWLGFVFGLLTDVFFGNIIGFYACLYMFVGYLNGAFEKILFSHDIKLPLLLIVCTDFVYSNVCYILLFLLKGKFDYLYYLRGVILPELIYTTVLACIIYPFIHFIFEKIDAFDLKHNGETYIEEQ
ncbi:MAG: rod shape-determining protein MreD [Lachnospiraceae bacterium]|nr:rod shape-determining protein MreD [Lachnospiraceae bacterium]